MKWTEIRQKHPNKFILIGDVVEEKISETKYRILEGNILKVSEDGKEIRKAYQQHKQKGMNVLFSLPTTPMDFIIEDVPVKGINGFIVTDVLRYFDINIKFSTKELSFKPFR